MKTQLLCTFSNIRDYRNVVGDVDRFYKIVFGKVYVLQNTDDVDEVLLTYNIDADSVSPHQPFFPNTISVHRKKDSNTIYTINSLNELIKKLNNGVLDTRFSVNWNDYSSSILLTDSVHGVRVVPTKLHQIIKI
jgi:hypothetical protein